MKTRIVRAWEIPVVRRFAKWMADRDWGGWTCPLPFVTLLVFWRPYTLVAWRHEMTHAEQAERLGWWRWWRDYVSMWVSGYIEAREADYSLGEAALIAYDTHPMEVEAYGREDARRQDIDF